MMSLVAPVSFVLAVSELQSRGTQPGNLDGIGATSPSSKIDEPVLPPEPYEAGYIFPFRDGATYALLDFNDMVRRWFGSGEGFPIFGYIPGQQK